MTTALQHAFDEAAKLPPAQQEVLASLILSELAAEDDFDRAIEASPDLLTQLVAEAQAEYEAGETEELDPERL